MTERDDQKRRHRRRGADVGGRTSPAADEEAADGGAGDGGAADGEAGDGEAGAGAGDGGKDAETISEGILEELRELEELRDRHLRLAAEFDNYRRRTRRELLQMRETAQADLASDLLDVLDDLRRVIEAPTDGTTLEALHEGVGLVERKLTKALADAGMEPIDPAGEPFDPNLHEALLQTPTDDPEMDEIVDQVLLTGYRFGDRLLRPARVSVLKYDEDGEGA
ncbi:MAG: nucleotide exchange factor GrpE [Gemmatimonadota bacterium]